MYEVPAVIDECCRQCRGCLLYSPIPIVVLVGDEDDAVRGSRLQSIGGIVGECQVAIKKHVPVGIMGYFTRRREGAEDGGVLVEVVCRIGVRRRPEAVAVDNAITINKHSPAPCEMHL